MACLQCGYCCVMLSVILPDGSPKIDPSPCKFLIWEGPLAICKIYGKPASAIGTPWEETPCGRHNTDLSGECRIGQYVQQDYNLRMRIRNSK